MQVNINIIEGILTTFKKDFKVYITDQTIPLDERWDFFKQAIEKNIIVDIDDCYWTNCIIENELKLDSWYDYFNMEPYEIKTFVQIMNKLENWSTPIPIETLNRIKEDMLASGYSGFKNDW